MPDNENFLSTNAPQRTPWVEHRQVTGSSLDKQSGSDRPNVAHKMNRYSALQPVIDWKKHRVDQL